MWGSRSTQCIAAWRRNGLAQAKDNQAIQGYADGVFWERNALSEQNGSAKRHEAQSELPLFPSTEEA